MPRLCFSVRRRLKASCLHHLFKIFDFFLDLCDLDTLCQQIRVNNAGSDHRHKKRDAHFRIESAASRTYEPGMVLLPNVGGKIVDRNIERGEKAEYCG